MIWRRKPGPSAGQGGFTLLEMIIVLVILGLVIGIVVARGPQRSRGLEARAAISAVVQTLRGARGRAIATNRPVLVAVDGATRSLSVDNAPPLVLPPEFAVTAASGLDTVAVAKPIGIRFAPDGSATGGRIILADGKRQTLVGVDWLTGRISVGTVDAK